MTHLALIHFVQSNALKNENVPPTNTVCIRLNSSLHFDLLQHLLPGLKGNTSVALVKQCHGLFKVLLVCLERHPHNHNMLTVAFMICRDCYYPFIECLTCHISGLAQLFLFFTQMHLCLQFSVEEMHSLEALRVLHGVCFGVPSLGAADLFRRHEPDCWIQPPPSSALSHRETVLLC